MSVAPVTPVSDAQRATLAALADVLVPEAEGMPSASQADVAGVWLDEVLRVRPDLQMPLEAVLARAAGGDPREQIGRLRTDSPDGFATLALVVTGAYYLNPEVRERIGYPGQQAHRLAPDQAEKDLRGGLLDPVVARGPIYRPTPAREAT